MNPIQRCIAVARSRLLLQAGLSALGWAALAGVSVATVVLLTGRLLALPVPLWSYAVIAGVALLTVPVVVLLRRPSAERTATMIDERLGLKDRLATALYARDLAADPFAREVVADAQRAAQGLTIRRGFPLRLTRVWAYVPPAAGVVALLAVFVAPRDLLGLRRAVAEREAQAARTERARQQVFEAVATIMQIQLNEKSVDPHTAKIAAELAQLSTQNLSNPELRRTAEVRISAVQDKLSQAAKQKQAEANALKNTMSRLESEAGPADKFVDALRRGDFDAARQAIAELAEQVEHMPPEERAAFRQQLQELARQLENAAQQFSEAQAAAQQQVQQTLEQAGLTPQQIQQLQKDGMDPPRVQQAVQQALQNQGVPPQQAQQQAQQTAQQVQQQQQAKQAAQQVSQRSSGLSSALDQLAQSVNPPQQQQPAPPQQSGPQQQAQGRQNQQQGATQQQGQPQGMPGQTGQQPGQQVSGNQQQTQGPGEQQQGGQMHPGQGDAPQQAQDGQPQSGGQQQAEGGRQQGGQQAGGQQSGSGPQQSAQQVSQQLEQLAQMQSQLQQLQQTQSQLQQAMQNMSGESGGSGSGQQGSPQGGGAGQQQARGGAVGDDLLEQLQPRPPGGDGRQGGQGGSKAGQGDGGDPLGPERRLAGYSSRAEADLGEGQGKIIAQWLEKGEAVGGEATVEFSQVIKEAKLDAERAVTDDHVPKRYHRTIRDYFDQVPQSPERIGPPPAPR